MKNRPTGSTEDVVSRSYKEMGGIKEVGHHVAVLGEKKSATQLYAYTDPDERDQISYDLMRRLVQLTGCTAPAEDMAALAGGFFVPCEISGEKSIHTLTAKTSKEYGEAFAAVVEVMQDPTKRPQARKELRDLMHVLACMDAFLSSDEPASDVVALRSVRAA